MDVRPIYLLPDDLTRRLEETPIATCRRPFAFASCPACKYHYLAPAPHLIVLRFPTSCRRPSDQTLRLLSARPLGTSQQARTQQNVHVSNWHAEAE